MSGFSNATSCTEARILALPCLRQQHWARKKRMVGRVRGRNLIEEIEIHYSNVIGWVIVWLLNASAWKGTKCKCNMSRSSLNPEKEKEWPAHASPRKRPCQLKVLKVSKVREVWEVRWPRSWTYLGTGRCGILVHHIVPPWFGSHTPCLHMLTVLPCTVYMYIPLYVCLFI